MTRKKVSEADQLTRKIGLRVSEPFHKKMKGWLENSNCQTIAELARMILYKEEIIWYHKDTSFETMSVELTAIRKELRSIGTNINQVTRYFNGVTISQQKILEANKILEEFKEVTKQLLRIESMIETITKHGRQSD